MSFEMRAILLDWRWLSLPTHRCCTLRRALQSAKAVKCAETDFSALCGGGARRACTCSICEMHSAPLTGCAVLRSVPRWLLLAHGQESWVHRVRLRVPVLRHSHRLRRVHGWLPAVERHVLRCDPFWHHASTSVLDDLVKLQLTTVLA